MVYKFDHYRQFGLSNFDQSMGLKMNLDNRWIKKASMTQWEVIEAATPKEFVTKMDLSLDENGMAWFEKLPSDAYNKSGEDGVDFFVCPKERAAVRII